MTKLISKWILLLPLSLFMAIFGRLIAPILPFFVQDNGYLPKWLWWFQTPFDTADGDNNHFERHPGTDWWSTYKRRVAWFTRNVAYGFDMSVCGIEVNPDKDKITYEGNPDIGDASGQSGKCFWQAHDPDGELIAFQWMYVYHYDLLKWHKCVRIGVGWKIWDDEKLRSEPAQYWAYFNPLK